MNVRFYLSYDNKITLKSHFCSKNIIILSLCMQCCYGNHNLSSKSSILMHGVISLPDATSYDKFSYPAAYTFASGAKNTVSLEPSQWNSSFVYPKHVWLRTHKIII